MHVTRRAGVALLIVYVAWGGTYPAIRVMVETVPPLLGTAARFLVAGVVLYAWLLARGGRRRVRTSRRELAGAALIGTVILGDIGLLALAEQEVPAGLAALIIASVPLWVVVLRPLAGERIRRGTLGAVAAGFGGVGILVTPGGSGTDAPLGWLLVLVGAAAIEALGQYASRHAPLPRDALLTTALELLAAGAVLLAAGALAGETGELRAERLSLESLWAFAYLVGPGSLLAYPAFVWLLANVPISTVSTYAYVNPVVALVAGALVLSEPVSAGMAAGALAVVASVALVLRSERHPAPETRKGPEGPLLASRRTPFRPRKFSAEDDV